MSTTALLVIDVQKDVVAHAFKPSETIANINNLIHEARAKSVPVIWVQHSDEGLIKGSAGWEIVDELKPNPSELLIHKTNPSSFDETALSQHLESLGVTKLVITGAQTDMCVNATSNAGVEKGFNVTLVSDAHTTEDQPNKSAEQIIKEKNVSFGEIYSANQIIEVLATSEIRF